MSYSPLESVPVSAPLITLLTDFGLEDAYVGVMKGVIAGICPQAPVVDICHTVTPYSIPEGGFVLQQAWPYFPAGSIHVVVVDPGVGSARRPLLVQAMGHFFIGPDNGVFSMVLRETGRMSAQADGGSPTQSGAVRGDAFSVRVIENPDWMLPVQSHTFHGRDVFAPAAARLALGASPQECGPLVLDALRQSWDLPIRSGKRYWNGAVLKADRFGNLISNFPVREFPLREGHFSLAAGTEAIHLLRTNYAEARHGEFFLIAGSSGYWEISMNQGNAAKRLGIAGGSPLELSVLG